MRYNRSRDEKYVCTATSVPQRSYGDAGIKSTIHDASSQKTAEVDFKRRNRWADPERIVG